MTDEERIKKRDADIDAMIDRFNMTEKCNLSREQIHRKVQRGMVLNNFAFILADAANTALMDMETELKPLGVAFSQKDKQNFNEMMKHVVAAKKWAEKSALPIYEISEAQDACADSDWWYNFLKLVDDRIGDNAQKTNLLLEYLLNMPKEVGLFDVRYEDFKQFKSNK